MTAQRIREIRRAIDELATEAAEVSDASAGSRPAPSGPSSGDDEHVVARLAELWSMLADLEPDIARRLHGYIEP